MTNQVRPKMVGQRDRAKFLLDTFFPIIFQFWNFDNVFFFQFLFKEGRSPIAWKHLKKNKKGLIGFWAGLKKSIILQKIGKLPVF